MPTQARNASKGTDLAHTLVLARTFWGRLVGLLGRRELPPGHGLLLRPASSIHTLFMRFPIDAVFLDEDGRVVRTVSRLRPFHVARGGRRARTVLELPAGAIAASGTFPGDRLVVHNGADPPSPLT